MTDLIDRSSEASKGGFQSILKLEGLLASVDRVEGNPEFADEKTGVIKDQAKVTLEDVIILEMVEGEPEPDLTDDRFTFYMNYAPPGKDKAHQNTFYIKGFVKSGEELAKVRGTEGGWRTLIGTRVVMERQTVICFTRKEKNEETGEMEPKDFTGTNLVFVTDDAGDTQAGIEDHVKKLIIGTKKPVALRAIMSDSRTKRDPQWREALNQNTLADKLGLKVNEAGVFEEA